jgi:serine/threonine-protein kinase RsbT
MERDKPSLNNWQKTMKQTKQTIIPIHNEMDIVAIRSSIRDISRELELPVIDQARLTTAISTLARQILRQIGKGNLTVQHIQNDTHKGVECIFTSTEDGRTASDLEQAILNNVEPLQGMGMGLSEARQFMDEMIIESHNSSGATIVCRKWCE